MSNITEAWEKTRLAYQQRYIMWTKRWHEYHNEDDRGHINECSYVLINIFGLTDKQIKELEHNYSGFTNDDLCKWHCDEYGRWHTECHILADNDPLEYAYCPYCGKNIKAVE